MKFFIKNLINEIINQFYFYSKPKYVTFKNNSKIIIAHVNMKIILDL